MRRIPGALALLTVLFLAGAVVLAGPGPNPVCPDADGDGICNGHDPDYVPGDECPGTECPRFDCPDADGDGICNGQDDDYVAPGDGPQNRAGRLAGMVFRLMAFLGFGRPGF